MKELWYKNVILYAIDVKTFQDSNGDGIGDFKGLLSRLPYLKSLGINCLWLLPFYPSRNRDNGYDVDDYYNVDPRLGTLDDFKTFVREAKRAGIRVIIDLVVQHTSDEHPWFKAAISDENSPYRKYYIWAKQPTTLSNARNVFPGEEKRDVWTYNKEARLWYHHWFYHFQPDLDVRHAEVKREIFQIAKFWMSFGVSGFRVDAAGLLFTRIGMPGYHTQTPGPFLRDLRDIVVSFERDGVLLGEADVHSNQLKLYFGAGDRIHVLYNFVLNQQMLLALVEKQSLPITNSLKKQPKISKHGVWINFLRNLDEFNLEKLDKKDIKEIKTNLKITPDMWIYKRGIRRRIAPLFPDRSRLKMMWGLTFSLPGSPMMVYGDEIGMGDDLSLPFRLSVRTVMQWDKRRNAGFSKAHKKNLVMPVIDKGKYSYKKVNAEDQEKNKDSLLYFIKQLTSFRKKYLEIGYGQWEIFKTGSNQVFGLKYKYKNKTLITMQNLSDKLISLNLPEVKLFKSVFKVGVNKRGEEVNLESYGQMWLRK